ncbi:oxygen-independent coproporphyrinogen-3 oxidase [Spirosoma lacussanchae]|uniref:radical SAM family heme chaperone HemW n=1 Tax=Spirosoma lacussanchae TaxID=1884249 RepID=UPI001109E63F|nr:radical SAM family heme chaperone HemW [Spirosoma lacussanchae]
MHLYVHIPFCKQACHYCDFHFSTSLGQKSALVDALCAELAMQADYLPNKTLETIYLGGGTPSLLTEAELDQLFSTIYRQFTLVAGASGTLPEITLEANPDDLNPDKLRMLNRYVNRLSIGIQTFDEPTLRWMNRAHTAVEAHACVSQARNAGFENLSVDLIYGIPVRDTSVRDTSAWQTDVETMLALPVTHLSAYALTIESDTAFGRWTKTGKLPPADEGLAATQFEELTQALTGAGYHQYEISNFARPNDRGQIQYARHNTAYWQRRPYLGIGPSAHSYNGFSRQYNIANNGRYIAAISAGTLPATVEELSVADQVNEYLLTGLRTQWGCSVAELSELLGADFTQVQARELNRLYASGWLTNEGGQLLLTQAGKLFADRVSATLFVE